LLIILIELKQKLINHFAFKGLRSLAFTADIFYMIHSQAARDVIVNSFPWESMKLECLALSVGMKETEAINVSYIKVVYIIFISFNAQ